MPIEICTDVALTESFRIGKGTIGHITQIRFHPRSTFVKSNWTGIEVTDPIPPDNEHRSHAVECILIQVYQRETEIFFSELGPGITPIYPQKQIMSLTGVYGISSRKTATCIQLPIVPAFSLVYDSIQGKTVDMIIIADPLLNRSDTDSGIINMIFSRSRTIEDMLIIPEEGLEMEMLAARVGYLRLIECMMTDTSK